MKQNAACRVADSSAQCVSCPTLFETSQMKRLRLLLLVLGIAIVLPVAFAQPTEPVKAHGALVHAVAVAPDGKMLATAGFDNLVKLWEIAPDGKLKEKTTLKGHTGPVYAVAFHPTDEKLIATASQDKTARLWELDEGKMKVEFKGHADIVDTIAFSPDGKSLATASADKSVRLWNQADGKELKNLGSHDGSVYSVCFSPDSKLLASAGAGKDNLIKLWDVAAQKELKQLKGHEQPVTGVTFLDDTQLVSVSMDRTIRIWNVSDGKETKKAGPTEDDAYAVAWAEKTKTVAVCGYSGLVSVWRPGEEKGDKLKSFKPVKSPGYCVAFTADGKMVITGHDNGTVAVSPVNGK